MALASDAADGALLPSLEANLPNVMLEAHGSGTPVVAFGVGGIPEVLQDTAYGRVASPGDVAGLAESSSTSFGRPPTRRRPFGTKNESCWTSSVTRRTMTTPPPCLIL